jgi:hypothetical protein
LQGRNYSDNQQIRKVLEPDTKFGKGYWADLSGMICPYEALNQLLESVENGNVLSLEEVNSGLAMLHKNYYNYEWTWAADVLEKFYGKSVKEFEAEDVIEIVEKWIKSVLEIDKYLYEDAQKEFSMIKMTGFGVDGQNGARELDFAEVRGEFESNATVKVIKEHMEKKANLGNEIIALMKKTIETKIVAN